MPEVRDNGRVSAGSGATARLDANEAAFLPTNAALYYGITMKPAVALFFGWVRTRSLGKAKSLIRPGRLSAGLLVRSHGYVHHVLLPPLKDPTHLS